MDGVKESDKKYQKLALEYSKLKAQASVLRKAVLEEQSRATSLREQLRRKESILRRSEQELDSLTFRNKQLELRVATLQNELAIIEGRKHDKARENNFVGKTPSKLFIKHSATAVESEKIIDALFIEELEKKILENAQLTTLMDEKDKELLMYVEHVKSMEVNLGQQVKENSSLEKQLRQELDSLQSKNVELQSKLIEAGSMVGSEDAVSASDGSDSTPLRGASENDRILRLEKEAAHWRSLYELSSLHYNPVTGMNPEDNEVILNTMFTANCSCSTTATGIGVNTPSSLETSKSQSKCPVFTNEQLFDYCSRKFEDLLEESLHTKSQINSLHLENENLQNCLGNATQEIEDKNEQIENINKALQLLEEDLASTRTNYETQINVLTEQILSLSDQLARHK